jgi:hypothetical protein
MSSVAGRSAANANVSLPDGTVAATTQPLHPTSATPATNVHDTSANVDPPPDGTVAATTHPLHPTSAATSANDNSGAATESTSDHSGAANDASVDPSTIDDGA